GDRAAWNKVLVLGEAQNLSQTYSPYVNRLKASSPDARILRHYQDHVLHVRPWDDGTLKLAMCAVFGGDADRFAVSNAVLWSHGTDEGRNASPDEILQSKSVEVWNRFLLELVPDHVVTTGKIAGAVIAAVKRRQNKTWKHWQLPSASPL